MKILQRLCLLGLSIIVLAPTAHACDLCGCYTPQLEEAHSRKIHLLISDFSETVIITNILSQSGKGNTPLASFQHCPAPTAFGPI